MTPDISSHYGMYYGMYVLFFVIPFVMSERERSVFMIRAGSRSTNNFRVFRHKTVALECYYSVKTETNSLLPSVNWWHRGHVISKGTRRAIEVGSSIIYVPLSNRTYSGRFGLVQTTRLSQLTISDVEYADIGEYRCQVEQETPRFTNLLMTLNPRFGTDSPKKGKISSTRKSLKTTEMLTNKPITEFQHVTKITYDSKKIIHEKIIIMACVLITIGCIVTSILSILFVKHYADDDLKKSLRKKFYLNVKLVTQRCQPKRQRTISPKTMSNIESNFRYLKPSSLITADYYKKSSQII